MKVRQGQPHTHLLLAALVARPLDARQPGPLVIRLVITSTCAAGTADDSTARHAVALALESRRIRIIGGPKAAWARCRRSRLGRIRC